MARLTAIGAEAVAVHDAQDDTPAANLEMLYDELASFFSGLQPVLDLGCVSGKKLIPLVHRGIDLVGIDIDVDMVAATLARAPSVRGRVLFAAAEQQPFIDEAMGGVLVAHVWHLLLTRPLREIHRGTATRGAVIVRRPGRCDRADRRTVRYRRLPPSSGDRPNCRGHASTRMACRSTRTQPLRLAARNRQGRSGRRGATCSPLGLCGDRSVGRGAPDRTAQPVPVLGTHRIVAVG